MRRMMVTDKHRLLQMRRCISAACEMLSFARMDADKFDDTVWCQQ